MILECDKISVSLGAKEVLKSVSLMAKKGELIGLIGPNGAGKSTLLKACAGLLPHRSGSIDICGKNLVDTTPRKLASYMAYLPQDREVNWPITVSTVIGLGRQSVLGFGNRLGEADYTAIQKAMCAVDIGHLSDRAANQLSGGEKACVLMARALAQEPQLLLADEPVAGLDPSHSLSLMNHLKEKSRQGMTVIVVMHDLTLAGQFCDRLMCLHKGKLASMGKPSRVLTVKTLKEVYGVKAIKARYGNTDLFVPVSMF